MNSTFYVYAFFQQCVRFSLNKILWGRRKLLTKQTGIWSVLVIFIKWWDISFKSHQIRRWAYFRSLLFAVDVKKRSFLTSLFLFVFLNASSHLCFRLFAKQIYIIEWSLQTWIAIKSIIICHNVGKWKTKLPISINSASSNWHNDFLSIDQTIFWQEPLVS